MSAVTLICVLAFQLISCQCRTFKCGYPKGYNNLAYGRNSLSYYLPSISYGSCVRTNGIDYGSRQSNAKPMAKSGFFVTSASSIIPSGVSFISDGLNMDGILRVYGQLPVLGTVALDGNVYGSGQGAVSYDNGNVNNFIGLKLLSDYSSGFINPIPNSVKGILY
ncbi:hypothetical protein KGM_212795 [Danaus plexippus plexippus]|uniref:Uncharacterized protein n=1 Tax=Danaus plexippus plexippus TaxID=278856 RepID=A0A212F8C5_DANPL|nr:hypothetical protein KGM_212795 [Danaus plexippus plexippus]